MTDLRERLLKALEWEPRWDAHRHRALLEDVVEEALAVLVRVQNRENRLVEAALAAAGAGCEACVGLVPCESCQTIVRRVQNALDNVRRDEARKELSHLNESV